MKNIYNQIIKQLNLKPELGMNANSVGYSEVEDKPYHENGELVKGRTMTVTIPDAWMKQANVSSAEEFLQWLNRQ